MRLISRSLFTLFLSLSAATAQEPPPVNQGIEGEIAPPLGVSTWIQLPEGKDKLELGDFKGKILVMLLYQHTCEASQKRAFPTLQNLVKKFSDEDEVAFLAIQTPFESFSDNTESKLILAADKFSLRIPFGHLAKTPGFYSINEAYRTGGTPWWVIINPLGVIEYNGFFLNPEIAEQNLAKMIAGEPLD